MQVMKVIKINAIIRNKYEHHLIQIENHKNHENKRIVYNNHENHENSTQELLKS